jgi:predicted transposase/invertase (TIGR01784 family)
VDIFYTYPLLVHLYTATELATMTVKQRQNYDKVMTTEIDRMCEISYAKKQGKAEGKVEDAKAMLADNMPIERVSKYTGLTPEEIAAL